MVDLEIKGMFTENSIPSVEAVEERVFLWGNEILGGRSPPKPKTHADAFWSQTGKHRSNLFEERCRILIFNCLENICNLICALVESFDNERRFISLNAWIGYEADREGASIIPE